MMLYLTLLCAALSHDARLADRRWCRLSEIDGLKSWQYFNSDDISVWVSLRWAGYWFALHRGCINRLVSPWREANLVLGDVDKILPYHVTAGENVVVVVVLGLVFFFHSPWLCTVIFRLAEKVLTKQLKPMTANMESIIQHLQGQVIEPWEGEKIISQTDYLLL